MTQKILIAVGILLFGIIAVQSYYLFHLSERVNQVSQVSSPDSVDNSSPLTTPRGPDTTLNSKDWNPFREMQRMQNEMEKMFSNMRSQFQLDPGFDNLTKSFSFSPNVDVKEEKDQIVVKADIPGSDESNINVTVDNDRLTISADTKKSSEQKNKGSMFRSERFIGRFERSITLPAAVDASKMKTDYKDGVLTVILPRA